MHRRTLVGVSTFIAIAILATSCSRSSDSTPSTTSGSGTQQSTGGGMSTPDFRRQVFDQTVGKRVAWVPVGLGVPLTEEWTYWMKTGFEDAGMEFITRDPNWDTTKQAEAVQSLINEKPDLLIVHNFDVQLLAKLIQQAEEEGIYVIEVNMISNYKSDAFVGADTTRLGELLATDIVGQCGEGSGTSGKVAIIQGDATSGFVLGSLDGAMPVFEQDPTITVVASQPANWDRTQAYDITSTILQQHPDLCAVWGMWDQMTYGAATAVDEAGLKGQVKVFSSDNSTLTCEAIRDGLFYEAYSYAAPWQGHAIVAIGKYLLQSGIAPGTARTAIFSPLVKIDASNYDQPGACYDGHGGSPVVS